MTGAERLAEERLEELEANHDRLIGVIEVLVGIVARHNGAEPSVRPITEAARPTLRVLQSGGGS